MQHLGERIIKHGYTLLTGCRGSLDKAIAEAAHNRLESSDQNRHGQVLSYRLKNEEPAHRWARIAGKSILGIAQFGGSGAKIFERERDRFEERYSHLVEAEDFDILNQDTEEVHQPANDVVALCER